MSLKTAVRRWFGRSKTLQVREPAARQLEDSVYDALLERNDVCFDIGANKGALAIMFAAKVGIAGRVYAFEPVWPLYERMCREVAADTTLRAAITTIPWGLSDRRQSAVINVPHGDYGEEFGVGSMADPAAWAVAQDRWRKEQSAVKIRSYRAEFVALDDFLEISKSPEPDFIKIDVEGAELFVLRGAKEFFTSGARPLMLIELFAPWEKAFGYQPWEPLSFLLALGYRTLFICPEGVVEHTPTEHKPFPPEYERGYNIIAYLPNPHARRIARLESLRADNPRKCVPFMPPGPCPNRVEA
ncbi:MAG: FkbM family methyltransferase [Pirellulales bacterium]